MGRRAGHRRDSRRNGALAHHVAGRGLRARKAWARNFALMLAAFNLLLLPLGTALGLYTLWVLLHEQVRAEFHA